MDTRKIAREYRLATWAQLARERSESGQSVREFCRSRDIKENTYYHWQRRLRDASAEALAPMETQLPAPSGWAAITKVEAPTLSTSLTVEVGAFRVAVDGSTDTELLSRTLKTLATLC